MNSHTAAILAEKEVMNLAPKKQDPKDGGGQDSDLRIEAAKEALYRISAIGPPACLAFSGGSQGPLK